MGATRVGVRKLLRFHVVMASGLPETGLSTYSRPSRFIDDHQHR